MITMRLLISCAGLALFSAAATAVPPPPRYTVQALDIHAPANEGYITGMNNLGHVSYWTDIGGQGQRGYIWDGEQNVLLEPASDQSTIPMGINNAGEVAGFYGHLSSRSYAAFWDKDHQLHTLGMLGGDFAAAQAINDSGLVAGVSDIQRFNDQNYLFTWDGTQMHNHGPTPTIHDEVVAMNNAGQILGRKGGGVTNGWIWDDGQYTFLNDLEGGTYSAPYALNARGMTAGMSWPSQNNAKAVVWDKDSTDPEALPVPDGTDASAAYSINNRGQVVGYAFDPELTHLRRAMLWDHGRWYSLTDLIDSGETDWQLTEAWEINERGQILVAGHTPEHGWTHLLLTQAGHWSERRANFTVVSTGIPEPASAAALCLFAALATISNRARRLPRL